MAVGLGCVSAAVAIAQESAPRVGASAAFDDPQAATEPTARGGTGFPRAAAPTIVPSDAPVWDEGKGPVIVDGQPLPRPVVPAKTAAPQPAAAPQMAGVPAVPTPVAAAAPPPAFPVPDPAAPTVPILVPLPDVVPDPVPEPVDVVEPEPTTEPAPPADESPADPSPEPDVATPTEARADDEELLP